MAPQRRRSKRLRITKNIRREIEVEEIVKSTEKMKTRKSKRLRRLDPDHESQEDVVAPELRKVTKINGKTRKSKRLRGLSSTHVSQESDVVDNDINNDDDDAALQKLDHEDRVQVRKERRIRLMREEERQGIPENERRRRFMERRTEDMEDEQELLEIDDDEEEEDIDESDNVSADDEEADEDSIDGDEEDDMHILQLPFSVPRVKSRGSAPPNQCQDNDDADAEYLMNLYEDPDELERAGRLYQTGTRATAAVTPRLRRSSRLEPVKQPTTENPPDNKSKRLKGLLPSYENQEGEEEEVEVRFSTKPGIHKKRTELRQWLIENVKGSERKLRRQFFQLLEAAKWNLKMEVHFEQNEGFYVKLPNGKNHYLKSKLAIDWKRSVVRSKPIENHNVKYSNSPNIHARRVELLQWLAETYDGTLEQHKPRLLQLLEAAKWNLKKEVHFEQNEGFYVKETGGNYFLLRKLPTSWTNNISAKVRNYNKIRDKDPVRKLQKRQHHANFRARLEHPHNLYLASLVPGIQPLDKPLARYFTNPKIKQYIYPGQWISHQGAVAMRPGHFYDSRSPIFQALADTSNPHQCYELLTITCASAYARQQGEAFIMAYADEWNNLHSSGAQFILTNTADINPEDETDYEKKARNYARNNTWLFQPLDEDDSPHPPPKAIFKRHLINFPYGLKERDIKHRVVPSIGQGSNIWNE